ncbi:MAG: pyridoxine 5'-phosphate synthase [Pseudomonadota bacterium]
MTAALSVNVNKVAWLRNARMGQDPDVREMAQLCVDAGADGITVHPRPDQRHIRPDDVRTLATALAPQGVELNVEGNPFSGPTDDGYPGFLALCREVRPAQVTLVPDADDQLTSDHGWQIAPHAQRLAPIVASLREQGARVSLFVDPGCAELEAIAALGAHRVELYTEGYARLFRAENGSGAALQQTLEAYAATARDAHAAGLEVNAGHDLNLHNLTAFCAAVPNVLEVSIGQALIADALRFGLAETVRRYQTAIAKA